MAARPHRTNMALAAPSQLNSYQPGEPAPVSGVYAVTHGKGHRPQHDAVIIEGEELPSCRTCGKHALFQVLKRVNHITHDWNFAGPAGLTLVKK